jgi:Lon-like ATP-dependent protease
MQPFVTPLSPEQLTTHTPTESLVSLTPALTGISALHPRATSALTAFLRSRRQKHVMVMDEGIDAWRDWLVAEVQALASSQYLLTGRSVPVIYEPALSIAQLLGTAVGNHVREGVLHRADGGFLIVRVASLLQVSGLWQVIKGVLQTGKLSADDWYAVQGHRLSETLPLVNDWSIQLRLVLVGEAHHFFALEEADSDVVTLFERLIEFEDFAPRTSAMEQALMSVLLARCQSDLVMNVAADALALCCDYASRLAEDASRLSLRMDQLEALLLRAQDEAIQLGHELIDVTSLTLAMDNDRYEAGRLEAEYRQAITAGWLSIATSGEAVGQVNALTVYEVGRMAFGQPVKISAQTSPGNDGLVDIEKEVDLAGPIHSKGMLIVQGYLRGRFMRSRSMALTASVVMEQTYEGVEGDSASAAETLALLSSISQMPLRQDIAVTGAINQFGDVQAVGGINEKIEGFFRLCAMRGLTGSQGVLIPAVNQQSLMLAEDVRAACQAGQFHVYPIAHLDEALTMMTGVPAVEVNERVLLVLELMNPLPAEHDDETLNA